MIYTFITIIVVIASILLVAVVLIQNSKGGGLASNFQAQNNIMGVEKTTDFVEKATWFLVSVVVLLSIASAAFLPREESVAKSQMTEQVESLTAPLLIQRQQSNKRKIYNEGVGLVSDSLFLFLLLGSWVVN